MNLSKSQYTKYRSCPKRLWLYRNKKEVLTLSDAAQQLNPEQFSGLMQHCAAVAQAVGRTL